MLKVLDTNVLLDFPQVVLNEEDIIIATDVLKELDGLKLNANSETAFKARRAAVVISKNLSKIIFNSDFELENYKVDDKLLKIAQKFNGILITNDVYLKINCLINNVATKGYGGTDEYTGVIYYDIELDENGYNKELEDLLEGNLAFPSNINQYIIIRDLNTKEPLSIFQNQDGKMVNIQPFEIRNEWINKIYPRNPEQTCLFNALQNTNNTIVYAGGGFGTGKSFIINNYAISQLEKGKIAKIVYVPNNAYTANTNDLGALPGDLLDKTINQIGPLVDLIGIDRIKDWINLEKLEVVPIQYIRGRSLTNSIIIVNEAQNLTEDHIKLLIGRVGEDSRIFLDGDQKQTDSSIFKNKNGLKLLLELRKSPIFSKLFATVKLTTIERSLTARASIYLDEITGGI